MEEVAQKGEVLHEVYMPFSEDELKGLFAAVGGPGWTPDQHLKYYKRSAAAYKAYLAVVRDRKGKPISEMRGPCQKFWTASCLMTVYHSPERSKEFSTLLQKAYGPKPPINGISTWDDCVSRRLHLFFEPNLPSPESYKEWLRLNLRERQFIPYVLDSADGKANLEGPTNVDALLVNEENGFAVIIEAKVLSDMSCQVTHDVLRNQIARNIDVMLEENADLTYPLAKRDPERTLFPLLTPMIFKNNPAARFYGYKFNEYKNAPSTLGRDLPHGVNQEWEKVARRLGWLTWEEFAG